MATTTQKGSKRLLIDKANSTVVILTGVAAFICIFSLVASKTLLSQMSYQNRVISAKRQALNQLKSDIKATDTLKTAYAAFNATPQNVLNGNPSGNGAQDGTNSKIVLDALPSTYDFPALVLSIEDLMNVNGASVGSIGGSDDEVAQSANQGSGTPAPVVIPLTVSVSGNYEVIQKEVSQFEHSIRPMQIQTMALSGSQNNLSLNLSLQTYYQPAKSLTIGKKVVK